MEIIISTISVREAVKNIEARSNETRLHNNRDAANQAATPVKKAVGFFEDLISKNAARNASLAPRCKLAAQAVKITNAVAINVATLKPQPKSTTSQHILEALLKNLVIIEKLTAENTAENKKLNTLGKEIRKQLRETGEQLLPYTEEEEEESNEQSEGLVAGKTITIENISKKHNRKVMFTTAQKTLY